MSLQLPSTLIAYDLKVWYFLNTRWRTDFLDWLMPFMRNQYFWAPLYLFLLLFLTYNYGKRGWIWCLGFLLCFGLADQFSAALLKPLFDRLRPCNDPLLAAYVRNIVPCGSGKSFPSSHAANHFAMGIFSALTLRKRIRWIWIPFVLWAMVVSYAQVYVGVHFPLDVVCGGLLGSIIGLLAAFFFNRYFLLQPIWLCYNSRPSLKS
jgi:undecaprenyl-diphosphatase